MLNTATDQVGVKLLGISPVQQKLCPYRAGSEEVSSGTQRAEPTVAKLRAVAEKWLAITRAHKAAALRGGDAAVMAGDRATSVIQRWSSLAKMPFQSADPSAAAAAAVAAASASPEAAARRVPGKRRRPLRPEKHIFHDLYLETLSVLPVVCQTGCPYV